MDTRHSETMRPRRTASAHPTNEKGERIAIFYNSSKEARIAQRLMRTSDTFNRTVLPTMERLGLHPASLQQVLSFASTDRLAEAYARQLENEATKEMKGKSLPQTLRDLTREGAIAKAKEAARETAAASGTSWPTKPGRADTRYFFIDTSTGRMAYDAKKLKDDCTRYLLPEEKPAYDFLQAEAKRLNDFFKGRIEAPLRKCFYTTPGDTTNTIRVNKGAPFFLLTQPADPKT